MPFIHTLTGAVPPARFDGVPWASVRVEEAPATDGPWTEVETAALALDADPRIPQTRDLTFSATLAAGFYRLTWIDGTAGESPPTAPIFDDGAVRTPAQFATPDELAARLNITLKPEEVTRANVLLRLASGLIQDAAGQALALVRDDAVTLPGSWGDRIRLPQRPVVSVASVTLGGSPISAPAYELVGDELVRVDGWGGLEVGVVYTHGFADPPAIAKAICLEAAIRAWVNPASVESEQYGNGQVSYGGYRTRGGMLLTEGESAQLRTAFGRQVGTVVLH